MFLFHPYHVFMKTEYSSLMHGIWQSMVFTIVLSELSLTNHFLGYRSLSLKLLVILMLSYDTQAYNHVAHVVYQYICKNH